MLGLDLTSLGIVLTFIAVSFLISYLTAQHAVKQAGENARAQLELRLSGLTTAIAELETHVAELAHTAESLAAVTRAPTEATPEVTSNGAAAPAMAKSEDEISPEILILISAAVTSFLGKKVRIRSAKMLQSPYEIVNPWAQQGRVIVQASHNLQVRHR